MFSRTNRNLGFLAWTVGAVLTLGVAAGASAIVPQLVNAEETPSAVTSAQVEAANGEAAPVQAAAEVAAPAPEVAVPTVIVPEPEAVTTPTAKAPARATPVAAVVPAPAPVVAQVVAPVVAAVPALAARTVPSAAQVQAAISRLSTLVGVPAFLISPSHIAAGGDQICTAFDQGQTFAQVKANGLSQVPSFVTVTPAAADEAVRTAVAMYCPAYASKLV